jgi:CubicO group peptidase (beta-lactamase class C family)
LGLLYLNQGRWQGEAILSPAWIAATTEPCALNPDYGLLWWLNTRGSVSAVADAHAYAARGAGGNVIFIWPARDIVIVLRWSADPRTVIDAILAAIE